MRHAWVAGVVGPVGFLAVCFTTAALRAELIESRGWVSWPSSMALGGPPAAVPQICAFLWLGGCYLVFALAALRPVLHDRVTIPAFVVLAVGDLMLAFPTDEAAQARSWHGTVHLAGVLLATVATLFAAGGSLVATRDRPGWRPWRVTAPVLFGAAFLGLVAGFDQGWAKVAYVVAITLPVIVLAGCVARDPAHAVPSEDLERDVA